MVRNSSAGHRAANPTSNPDVSRPSPSTGLLTCPGNSPEQLGSQAYQKRDAQRGCGPRRSAELEHRCAPRSLWGLWSRSDSRTCLPRHPLPPRMPLQVQLPPSKPLPPRVPSCATLGESTGPLSLSFTPSLPPRRLCRRSGLGPRAPASRGLLGCPWSPLAASSHRPSPDAARGFNKPYLRLSSTSGPFLRPPQPEQRQPACFYAHRPLAPHSQSAQALPDPESDGSGRRNRPAPPVPSPSHSLPTPPVPRGG